MSWNQETVQERIKKRDFPASEVTVTKLVKGKDFTALGVKEVRDVYGSHLYIDVPNFNELVTECNQDTQEQKKIIRALNTLQKVQDKLLQEQDLEFMQVQSARTHAINFRPFNDESALVTHSVVCAISHLTYIYDGFNSCFQEIGNLRCSIGISTGDFLVCNIGKLGQRDLLSLGNAANQGAKILKDSNCIHITKETYDLLPSDLQALFEKTKNSKVFKGSNTRWSVYPELKKKYAPDFDLEKLKSLTEDYKDSLPLSDIEISGTTKKLNFDELTERNNKRFYSASIYVDLDGFSAYVDKAYRDGKIKELIPLLNGIISEFQDVVQDHDGVPVQMRGDCLVGTFNLPTDTDSEVERLEAAIEAAIGLQSSMIELNNFFKDYPDLKVAIGIDAGRIIATKLGHRGEKERIILGKSVAQSEKLQQKHAAGGEIVIAKESYDLIKNETFKKHFKKTDDGNYSALNLTHDKLNEDFQKAGRANTRTSSVAAGLATVGISVAATTAQAYIKTPVHCWTE